MHNLMFFVLVYRVLENFIGLNDCFTDKENYVLWENNVVIVSLETVLVCYFVHNAVYTA